MRLLSISDIRTDAETQVRVRLDEATVTEYAEAFRGGAEFPPVVVFHDGSDYLLADGFHRVMGAIRAELDQIPAEIKQGGRAECLRFALGANASHGLRRTNADKRRSVEMAVAEWPNLSDRELAKICAVDHHTVASVRGVSESTGEIPQLIARTGGDGKTRRIPPPPMVAKPAATIPPPPSPPAKAKKEESPAVRDRTGYPIPAALLELWERSEGVQQAILTPISTIRGMLRRAQESKDMAFAEVNFSSVMSHLDQVYSDAARAKPHAVCPTCQGKLPDKCTLCKGRGFISEFAWDNLVPREIKEIRAKARQ